MTNKNKREKFFQSTVLFIASALFIIYSQGSYPRSQDLYESDITIQNITT
jgi:hypothetical protein